MHGAVRLQAIRCCHFASWLFPVIPGIDVLSGIFEKAEMARFLCDLQQFVIRQLL